MAHEDGRAAKSLRSVSASEASPLLPKDSKIPEQARKWPKSTVYRILATAFLVSPSFGLTQVPLIYVFGVMTCDEYYEHHESPPVGTPAYEDRCKVHAIEASTARALVLFGVGMTLFGVANLFFTGWMVKVWGSKRALLVSIIWPAIRLFIQIIGINAGAGLGIIITQCSQLVTIFGGPAGYLLALNSYATDVVPPVERTPVLGRLIGCAMFGTALGFLGGGFLEDWFSDVVPFQTALVLFCLSTLFTYLTLPYIPPNEGVKKKAAKSIGAFFEPLKMFTPRVWTLKDGRRSRQYGVLHLGIGAFLAVFATGYLNVLLQMYATYEFGFGASDNSKLIGLNFMVRASFLTFAFPAIIAFGRKQFDQNGELRWRSSVDAETAEDTAETSVLPDLNTLVPLTLPEGEEDITDLEEPRQHTPTPQPLHIDDNPTFYFDLYYARYSIFLDGILTFLATFAATNWQLYLVASVLPFAAGTGSAAKGVMMQMCAPEEKTDALSAISLLENVAHLSTVSLFGLVFSAFAEIGRLNLTFTCNAAVAFVGFIVLMFARFPPEGAVRIQKGDADEEARAGT